MSGFLAWLGNFLTGNLVGRVFDTIDKKVESEADREKLKADVMRTWLQNRVSLPWYVDALFIAPLAFWWASIIVYSMIWCSNCAFPQGWSIAALPDPLNEWAGWIIMSRFGVGAVSQFVRR